MSVLAWIVLGLVVGFMFGNIVEGRAKGYLIDLGSGIVGAVIGGLIATLIIFDNPMKVLDPYSLIGAVVGAVVVLTAIRTVRLRRRARAETKAGLN
ncbi:MAG TPA: GlsB/YeaQ/YmgE family stress response membrane protein [Acidiphilium sp.]